MSIDDDFPMSRTQARVLVAGLVIMGVLGVALFGGLIPGLKPNYTMPATLSLDGREYYYTSVLLNSPAILSNLTAPQPFSFHNVSFWLWVTNWGSPAGALVHGNGTEPNGTAFPFVLGQSNLPPVSATLFVSPDYYFAVSWGGGLLGGPWVELFVRV
ncbi:MAG TPA: hypothetical protein VEH28_01965 [Thermoplasmata archaeon]|nr:hypothetical protein [Thermoplasmata archaeon]